MNGSYQLQSFTENKESEVKRLKSQVELFFDKEFSIYKEIGINDGMKIIECGSGPGYLILNLASRLPNSELCALEIDPYLFEVLKSNSAKNDKNIFRAIQGSIYSTGEPDNYYDVVITRLVVEHLDKPIDALNELKRILKPGGKLIVVSNDFEYHVLTYPHIPELDEMYKAYCKSRIDQSGNPYVGRQIPVYFDSIDLDNINLNIATAHSKILGDQALLKAENVNISRNLVKDGYLSQETLDALTNKWFEMLQDPNHIIFRQLFIISGEKKSLASDNLTIEETTASSQTFSLNELLNTSSSLQQDSLADFLVNKVIEFMGEDDLEIEPSTKLSEYFIDSLVATDLASLLKTELKTELKLSDILRNYSINDIVSYVITNLNNAGNQENKKEETSWSEGEL